MTDEEMLIAWLNTDVHGPDGIDLGLGGGRGLKISRNPTDIDWVVVLSEVTAHPGVDWVTREWVYSGQTLVEAIKTAAAALETIYEAALMRNPVLVKQIEDSLADPTTWVKSKARRERITPDTITEKKPNVSFTSGQLDTIRKSYRARERFGLLRLFFGRKKG